MMHVLCFRIGPVLCELVHFLNAVIFVSVKFSHHRCDAVEFSDSSDQASSGVLTWLQLIQQPTTFVLLEATVHPAKNVRNCNNWLSANDTECFIFSAAAHWPSTSRIVVCIGCTHVVMLLLMADVILLMDAHDSNSITYCRLCSVKVQRNGAVF